MELKQLILITILSLFMFTLGCSVGEKSEFKSLEKETIELSIELTKLEIKKLKRANNETNIRN